VTNGRIRPAIPSDTDAIRAVVYAAYAVYLPQMDKPPGPMLDDYDARIAAGEAFVLDAEADVLGILILIDANGHLLLDNVATAPGAQGQGVGRQLVSFAESEARRRGYCEIRLYTHAVMADNVAYYENLGWEETHRGEQAGYQRIFMRKRL
jgi:GNAT superfamily N-acetyltransferase